MTETAQAAEAAASIVLFMVLIYVLIELGEAAPLGFETELDDHVEDAVGGWV